MDAEQLWIPALVAAVVTLSIEYFAKPRLEVRKERILERGRSRRELISVINLAHSSFGMLTDMLGMKLPDPRDRDALAAEIKRLKEEVGAQALMIVERARLLYDSSDTLTFEVVTAAAGTFRAVVVAGASRVRSDEVNEVAGMAIELLRRGPRTLKGRRFRRVARAWFTEFAGRGRREDVGAASA